MTSTDNSSNHFKLKNPTDYHLFASSQVISDPQNFLQDDFSDCFTTQGQFLSPSPTLHDFEDTESFINGSSIGNMMIHQHQQQPPFFTPSQESPSDYSSSTDFFSHPQPSSFLMDFHQQPFSAPAHIGYDNPLLSSSSSHINMAAYHQPPEPRSLEEYESIQLNHQLLSEKKRRRRESHNAVERRRRENINERIQELGTMLPEIMLEELASSVNINGGNNNKPNKGAILRKSVDHIRILQQDVTNHKQRIYELERQLASFSL